MDAQTIQVTLEKLRIKSGLHGDLRRKIEGEWAISFQYDRSEKVFTLTLHYGHKKSQTIALKPEHTETRSKSMWMADQTFRLSEEGVRVFTAQIHAAITRAQEKGLAGYSNRAAPSVEHCLRLKSAPAIRKCVRRALK